MKDKYWITAEFFNKLDDVLSDHWFSCSGEYNNDDVIEIQRELRVIIQKQDEE